MKERVHDAIPQDDDMNSLDDDEVPNVDDWCHILQPDTGMSVLPPVKMAVHLKIL